MTLSGGERRGQVPLGAPVVGFMGAGNYAGRVLIPAFKEAGASLRTVVSGGGVSAVHFGKKYGFEEASTDADGVLDDDRINTVVIATRHNSHARLVCKALRARKHVFVEKPLCLTLNELKEIESTYSHLPSPPSPLVSSLSPLTSPPSPLVLMVGFNRRFAPHIRKIKALIDSVKEPKSFVMTVNAGQVPGEHWTQDPVVGGGRIIGEACHFVDLLRFLAGTKISHYSGNYLGNDPLKENAILNLSFADGSVATIHYLAKGHKSFPKERLEVFCAGGVIQLDNFRKMKGYGWPGFKKMNLWRQDKGQAPCASPFLDAVRGESPLRSPLKSSLKLVRRPFDWPSEPANCER